ncbi:hypothetical protein HHI36_001365 [Cryptolaemus montrouzieri]|uniref:Uncharacterized protein n=1 Tax=Cryptolaemus montrouzieri TaxID=559131 RepID=A0ABD2P805_9CUCU
MNFNAVNKLNGPQKLNEDYSAPDFGISLVENWLSPGQLHISRAAQASDGHFDVHVDNLAFSVDLHLFQKTREIARNTSNGRLVHRFMLTSISLTNSRAFDPSIFLSSRMKDAKSEIYNLMKSFRLNAN